MDSPDRDAGVGGWGAGGWRLPFRQAPAPRPLLSALPGEAGRPVWSWLICKAVVWPVPSAFVRGSSVPSVSRHCH